METKCKLYSSFTNDCFLRMTVFHLWRLQMHTRLFVLAAAFAGAMIGNGQNPPANPTNLGNDPNGNPLRKALRTGHVSNYDESRVAPYTLPDPLTLSNGRRVRN